MEEDAEAVRAVDWDRTAADAAYRAEVERAQARARLVRTPCTSGGSSCASACVSCMGAHVLRKL